MDEKPKPEPDDKEQSKRFIDTVRELQVDESGDQFTRAIQSIVQSDKNDTKRTVKPKVR